MPPKDVRHLQIRSSRLRALLHEAWKHGNESYNTHSEAEGQKERHDYVNTVMVDQNFKKSE